MTTSESEKDTVTTLTAGLPRPTRLADVLRSERIKLGSIRSTRWAAILAVGLSAGFTGLMADGLFSAETEPGVDAGSWLPRPSAPSRRSAPWASRCCSHPRSSVCSARSP